MGKYLIGIDLGGTNIKGAVIDTKGNVIFKSQVPTLAEKGPETVAQRISKVITDLEEQSAKSGHGISCVGIGVPGQIEQGTVLFSPNLRWSNFPLVERLRQHTQLPVYIENDATVAALGEQWCGAGCGSTNMAMITIGTGIGGGLIINGSLYRGTNGSAGEIGHTIILPDGPKCTCGQQGCLETLSSATAMIRMANEAILNGSKTILSQKKEIEAKDIVEAAKAGDEVSLEIINKAAFYLGLGLANLINIVNPDTIVIGGGVSQAGEILFTPLRETAKGYSLAYPAGAVKIVPAELGNGAGSIGAAKMADEQLRHVLSDSNRR